MPRNTATRAKNLALFHVLSKTLADESQNALRLWRWWSSRLETQILVDYKPPEQQELLCACTVTLLSIERRASSGGGGLTALDLPQGLVQQEEPELGRRGATEVGALQAGAIISVVVPQRQRLVPGLHYWHSGLPHYIVRQLQAPSV